jgi:hypothetical protein
MRGWSNGDRVALRYDAESLGTVMAAGPEVSEVKFDDNVTRCIPNVHLSPAGPAH